jgi:hypothetical protein
VVVRDDVRVVSGALRVRGIVSPRTKTPPTGAASAADRASPSRAARCSARCSAPARVAPLERRVRATLSR